MTQPIVSVTPGISALFVYEDKDRFGVVIRITATVNGWTVERGGTIIAQLRGAVVTNPAGHDDIVMMLTAPMPLVRFRSSSPMAAIDTEYLLSSYAITDGQREMVLARILNELGHALYAADTSQSVDTREEIVARLLMPILARMEREGLLTRKDVGHE